MRASFHLWRLLRRPKNPICLGCATQNLPPQDRGLFMRGFGLHTHVSVCVTHYTGPTILSSNYTLTPSWPSVMPGPWYPSKAGLCVSKAPWYPFQAALWAYSGRFWVAPPGHTQILRPRNLWHISIFYRQWVVRFSIWSSIVLCSKWKTVH